MTNLEHLCIFNYFLQMESHVFLKVRQISFLIIIDILYLCKFVSIRLMCPYNLHIHHISILRRHILVRLNTSYLQRNTGSLWYNRNNRLLFHLMIRLLLLNRSTSISFNVYVRYFRYRFQIRWNEKGYLEETQTWGMRDLRRTLVLH